MSRFLNRREVKGSMNEDAATTASRQEVGNVAGHLRLVSIVCAQSHLKTKIYLYVSDMLP